MLIIPNSWNRAKPKCLKIWIIFDIELGFTYSVLVLLDSWTLNIQLTVIHLDFEDDSVGLNEKKSSWTSY